MPTLTDRLTKALRQLLTVSLPNDVSGRRFIDEAREVLNEALAAQQLPAPPPSELKAVALELLGRWETERLIVVDQTATDDSGRKSMLRPLQAEVAAYRARIEAAEPEEKRVCKVCVGEGRICSECDEPPSFCHCEGGPSDPKPCLVCQAQPEGT